MAPPPAPIHGRVTQTTWEQLVTDYSEYIRFQPKRELWLQSLAAINAYHLHTTIDAVEYRAETLTGLDGASINIPKILVVGFDPYQIAVIDKFFGAVKQELIDNPGFRGSRAMLSFLDAGGDTYQLLNAGGDISGASNSSSSVGGVTIRQGALDAMDQRDPMTESIIGTRDPELNLAADPKLAQVSTQGRFLDRFFHEMLHKAWTHSQMQVYDTNRTLLQNLQAPDFTATNVRDMDVAYGGTEEALVTLAPRLNLSVSDIRANAKAQYENQADNLNEARAIANAREFKRIQTTGAALDRATIEELVDQKYIKFDDTTLPPDATDAQEEAARNNPRNYKFRTGVFGKAGEFPQAIQDELERINVAVANGFITDLNAAIDSVLGFIRDFFGDYASEIGQIVGSTLGRHMFRDNNVATQITASTIIGTLAMNIGEEIELSLRGFNEPDLPVGFNNLGEDLLNAGVGAISSFLTAELFEDLGLEGTLAELGQSVFANQLTAMVNALRQGRDVSEALSAASNIAGLAQVVGGFIGTKLAQEFVEFDTVEGQIGAAMGSAFGAIAGARMGLEAGAKFGFWGAVIGAFVGYIVGGVIGTFFATTPRSGADVVWNETRQRFGVGRAWTRGPAPREGAIAISTNAAEVLNAMIVASGARVTDGARMKLGSFGTYESQFVWRTEDANGKSITPIISPQANLVINFGLLYATAQLLPRLVGGNVFVKRAIASTLSLAGVDINAMPALQHGRTIYTGNHPRFAHSNRQSDIDVHALAARFDTNVMLGNISTAADYQGYLSDRSKIDYLLAAEPDSTFAAGWAVTFARAWELGLMKRSFTDWLGGWNAYLDELNDGEMNGDAFTGAALLAGLNPDKERMIVVRDDYTILGSDDDTIDNGAKDIIDGTAGADSITVNSNHRIASTTGLTINGSAAGGGEFRIDVAAAISGLGGNDTIRAGDLGNDLLGGDGNDTLVGGKLDDWLFGDAGNDRLIAGAPANFQFADSDSAAVNAALGATSNGDLLDGGEGDDLLYGSTGSDWLRGGAGADTLRGGSGGDLIDGGAGNDRGANGEAKLLGGAGTDQYVFAYGDGADVIFDDADNSTPGSSPGDTLYARQQSLNAGTLLPDWAGNGNYQVDGSVRGGEDAISFGPGIGLQDIILRRSGTPAAPGQDLIIELTYLNPTTGVRALTGDSIIVRDWFESTHRVEWLRFLNGEELRIGNLTTFVAGSSGPDVIIGTGNADFMYGGDGNDTMFGLAGDDFGFGGEGNDMVAGDDDNDLVAGGTGNDTVIGGLGNDTVLGNDGDDKLNGSDGSDVLAGEGGNDEVVGGAGGDIFLFERGDGRDTFQDAYIDNWEEVWRNGSYVNGYVLDAATGTVSKNGVVYFDGTQWIGTYDYSHGVQTLRRHAAPVGGTIAANSGYDYVQFGVGIDIQDLMLRRVGNNLEIAIQPGDHDLSSFEGTDDRITMRDWYLTGNAIEAFTFVATGTKDLMNVTIAGAGTDNADTLTGTTGDDWITGNAGNDTVTGGDGRDLLSGNEGNDNLRGEAGEDVLFGGAGNDVLEGGGAGDVHIGGTGMDLASYANSVSPNNAVRAFLGASHTNTRDAARDTYISIEGLEGSGGADKLGGDDDANFLRGLAGNDTLLGGAGDDIYEIETSNGQDTINDTPFVTEEIISAAGVFNEARYQTNWVHLGILATANGNRRCFRLTVVDRASGEEVYRSRDAIDFTYATTFPETTPWILNTFPSSANQWSAALGVSRTGNSMTPGATNGPQTVREIFRPTVDGGVDTIEFGAGISLSDLTFAWQTGNTDLRITYASNQFVTISGQSDVNRAVEILTFRDGIAADLTRLVVPGGTASAGGDLVVGDANANSLEGLDGDDVLSGAAGTDTLRGGAGDDVLEGGAAADTLDGGTDSITDGVPIDQADPLNYGDTIRYVRSNVAVNINLATRVVSGGHAAGDVIVAVNGVSTIENVVGSEGFNDILRGDGRANRLVGLGGNDTLEGNAGDDVLVGGIGDDTLRGGDGEDSIAGETGVDILEGGNDKDLLAGGEGNDTLSGDAGNDVLSGGEGNDTLNGGADNDIMGGDSGVDQLFGNAGDDQIVGGEGDDSLFGGDGNDELFGELGNDQLSGDAGDDIYAFDGESGADRIIDASGTNRIIFNHVDASQVWITRSGSDLRIGVIGGSSIITVQGYYAAATPSRIASIDIGERSLNLALAEQLIVAMTASSGNTPAQMPEELVELVEAYWNGEIGFVPVVTNQVLSTSEDTALTGSVSATDGDNNITGYALGTAPARGSLNLNTTAGTWTYTPAANAFGADSFTIVVTDAEGNTATQDVALTITSVNDAPTAINASGLAASIDERDRPITGSSTAAIVLATLTVSDPDAGDPGDFASHAYTVDNANFEVVGGQLRLRDGVALDYETANSVSVNVTARDRNGAGLSVTRGFNFVVNNRDDYFYGGTGNDTLTGTAGQNLIYGLGGNDTLTGASANDVLSGGDGDDVLDGRLGNDSLNGDAGVDTFLFGPNTGADTVVDTAGNNAIRFSDVTTSQMWITRSGNDLRIGVIGGTSVVTVQGFYAPSGATLVRSIEAAGLMLHLAGSQALVTAMTSASVSTPALMPANVASMLNSHWFPPGAAPPMVTNQSFTTAEEAPFSGNVGAFDAENNITGYSVVTGPTRGAVNLNATTGAWTYTPNVNAFGTDGFSLRVTDATGNTAIQNVVMNVTSVNDAPTAINASGLVASIDERDRPITGSSSPAIVLATLTVSDPDAGDTGDFASHAYTVDNANFEVVGGQLRLRAGVNLDYETATSISVNVTATDRNGAGLSVVRNFTFAVNNRDDYFYGTAGNDTITGTAGQNLIYGRGGNDTLTGAGANDLLDGEDGNDTLYGLGGIDTLYGQIGDDILEGGAGNDTLRGGDGTDTLRGGDGDDAVYGDSGLDMLYGGIGIDTMEGGAHDDYLEGNDGNDTLRGGTENDMLIGGLGGDRFNGGAGTDTVSYASAAAGVTLSLATGTGTGGEASGDVFEDAIERIIGSGNNDSITGSAGDDYIEGGGGNDTILGGAGADTLIGGAGDDTIDAQAGNDILDGGLGSDILIGGDDDDTYRLDANSGTDEIRNFHQNAADIDVVGYAGVPRENLWFERSGNDLIVTAVGTTARTTITGWYTPGSVLDHTNYQVRFFQTGQWETSNINAEALVTLMAGHTRPTTVAAFDALRADPGFLASWQAGWNLNAPPTLGSIATQTVNEDGSITISLAVDDIITPNEGLTVTATRVNPSTGNPETTMLGSPSVQRDAAGNYSLVINTLSNVSGQGAIRITVTDPGNLSVSQTFLVNVTPVADQPGISGPALTAGPVAPATIVSFDAGSLALTLDAWLNDTDGSETLDIRISGATGGLSFNQGTDLTGGVWSFTRGQLSGLRLQAPPTRGDAVALTMTVVAREAANGNTWTRTATLNFDPNARPTGISEDRTLSFNEGLANGSGLAWFTRTDPDNDSASYSIVDSAGGRYSVRSDGLLMAGSTPTDYESATSHNIVVRVTDSQGLSFDRTFTVGVANVNEAPTALNADRTLSFNEGYANGTGLAWFTNTDPEGNASTYSIVDSAGGRYSVRSDGLLQAGATLTDFESGTSHNIVVRVTDAGGLSFDRTFTVGVANVNEAPTALNADRTLSFNEGYANGTGLAWFTNTDPENNASTYSIVDSAGGRYNVRSDGLLMAGSTPTDFESGTSHNIVVRVTDAGGLSFDRAFTVNVQNVNEAPTGLEVDRALSFNEGYANGTGLAWFSRTDPDNDGATYSIIDSAGGRYAVRSDGLLQSGSTPTDYESGGISHNIVVRVTDSGGLYFDRTFTVNVQNVNEAPSVNAASFNVLESNPGAGAYVMQSGGGYARVTGTDPEGATLRFQLVGGDTGMFSIDADGYLHLQGSLNYEGTRNYSVVARAWDGGSVGAGAFADQTISIAVANADEGPTVSYVTDPNTTAYNTFIGTLSGVDPESGVVSFRIVSSAFLCHIVESEFGTVYSEYDEWRAANITVNSAGRVDLPASMFPSENWGDGWNYSHVLTSGFGTFTAVSRDPAGNESAQITVNFYWYTSWIAPVVLDLDGDGVELLSAADSGVSFAMHEGGTTSRNGWIGAGDAFLALDRDGDGLISHGAEISFTQDLENASSDLEGLAAFDTNGNLSLDAGDERFADFQVWQDRNQDGVSQQDELLSLNAAGIESLSLLRTLTGTPEGQGGNHVSATTDFVRIDGSRGQASDVALEYQRIVSEVVEETPLDSAEEDVGDVDRGASPTPEVPARAPRRPLPPEPVTGDPVLAGPSDSQPSRGQRAENAGARARPWRVADMKFDEPQIAVDEWSPSPANRAPAALHASLSSITRRRLQMIDAMASFEPEGAAELALRPQRHVDSRTLELLTTVARTGSLG